MRSQLWTLALVFLATGALTAKPGEPKSAAGEAAGGGGVEFLEDTRGQTYLDLVTYRDRFVLDLLLLNGELRSSKFDANPENSYLCPRALLENFDLRGLNTPLVAPTPPKHCPRLKQTCCLPNDVMELEARWTEKLSPQIRYVQHYFKFYLRSLLAHSANFTEAAANVRDNHRRPFCRQAAESLINNPLTEDFKEEFTALLDAFLAFDYRLKRGFVCLLCDYENLGDLDFDSRLYGLNRDFCQALVDGALDFQHAAHRTVYRYVNTVSAVAECQRSMRANQTAELDFLAIDNSRDLEVCKHAKDHRFNVFANCLTFCAGYKLWSPEAPTYASIETLARIHQLARDHLFKDPKELTVSPPRAAKVAAVAVSKRDSLDIFGAWEHVFTDRSGVRFEHFADVKTEDF